jgi:hypothetical protein
MEEQPRGLSEDRPGLQRAIVLFLLAEERAEGWTCAALGLELAMPTVVVEEALERLNDEGVVCFTDSRVSISRATRLLDELGLIAI